MPEQMVVLEQPGDRVGLPRSFSARRVRSAEEVRKAFESPGGDVSVWVAATGAGLRVLGSNHPRRGRADRRLLVLQRLGSLRRSWLQALFDLVVAAGDGVTIRPRADLLDALAADNRDELFVAGALDRSAGLVTLYRGNLEPLCVPLSWFPPAARRPNGGANGLELTDSGQTIRIGGIEVAADAVLYDFDPEYRRRAKKRRIEQDDSFGGALRRLRNLRGLARSAFEPELTAKEVARIEHGKVAKPRASTVAALARRLGVKPEDISTY